MVANLDVTVESMNKMKQIQLNEEQAKVLAKKALTTRFTEEQVKDVKVDLDELLKKNCTSEEITNFEKNNDLDCAINLADFRFRANFFKTLNALSTPI